MTPEKEDMKNYKAHTRISGVVFVNSIPMGGESQSVQIGRNVHSITPARIEADGTAVAIDKGQRADGLLLKKFTHNRMNGQKYIEQEFTPWANVRGVQYGE
jgi:hypothetical protein